MDLKVSVNGTKYRISGLSSNIHLKNILGTLAKLGVNQEPTGNCVLGSDSYPRKDNGEHDQSSSRSTKSVNRHRNDISFENHMKSKPRVNFCKPNDDSFLPSTNHTKENRKRENKKRHSRKKTERHRQSANNGLKNTNTERSHVLIDFSQQEFELAGFKPPDKIREYNQLSKKKRFKKRRSKLCINAGIYHDNLLKIVLSQQDYLEELERRIGVIDIRLAQYANKCEGKCGADSNKSVNEDTQTSETDTGISEELSDCAMSSQGMQNQIDSYDCEKFSFRDWNQLGRLCKCKRGMHSFPVPRSKNEFDEGVTCCDINGSTVRCGREGNYEIFKENTELDVRLKLIITDSNLQEQLKLESLLRTISREKSQNKEESESGCSELFQPEDEFIRLKTCLEISEKLSDYQQIEIKQSEFELMKLDKQIRRKRWHVESLENERKSMLITGLGESHHRSEISTLV